MYSVCKFLKKIIWHLGSVFVFPLNFVMSSGDHPEVYFTKFGYIQNMKINKFKHPFAL
jgi:hypothetical protein